VLNTTYNTNYNYYLFSVITCEEPDVPSGGFVVGYDFNVHSSIEYHCEAGHLLKGEAVRMCNSDGEWSSRAPDCQCRKL